MFRLFFVSALLVLLSSCATTHPTEEPITDESHELWSQRQQQLSAIHYWKLRGRVALFVDEDVYNLGLSWELNKDHSKLKLEAALGQGVVQLEKNNTEVKLVTSEGETFSGQNSAQVLRQSTGWSIPVEGLEFWIKGINHDNSDYLPDIDSAGRATSLSQDGWQINFLEYSSTSLSEFNNPDLPHKIYMKRKNLALKIVIDQWQPQQNASSSELFPVFPE